MFNLANKLVRETYAHSQAFRLWLPLVYAVFLLLVGLVFAYGLGAGQLLPGYSPAEVETAQATAEWPDPLDNFLYWPYHAAVSLLRLAVADGVMAARLVSVFSALAAVAAFLALLRRRFGVFVSLAGAGLLACNSWFLQLARSGTPEISSLASVLVFLALLATIAEAPRKGLFKLGALIAGGLAWFTPLAAWLVLAVVLHLFYRQRLARRRLSPRLRLAVLSLLGLLVVLTVFALVRDQGIVPGLTGVPSSLPAAEAAGDNLGRSLESLFWRAPDNPRQWLANFPLLDVFAAGLLPFGLYAFWRERRKTGFKYCAVGLVGLLAAGALGRGPTTPGLVLLFPLALALAAAGLQELLENWKRLFPQNPLARVIGLNVLLALALMSVFYQLDRYFVAWADNPETRRIYSLEAQRE